MKCSLQFGSETIDYVLTFSNRKTLGISVSPDLSIQVKAPENANPKKVKEKVKAKAPWILKQKSHFLYYHPLSTKKKFVSGETHLYLGRQYQLKIIKSNYNEVKFDGRYFMVQCKSKAQVEKLITDWYKFRAKTKFAEIAEPLIYRFAKHKVAPKNLYIKAMKYRWGSCTAKGNLILNPELIKAPKPCIEYVIVHELCHLVHRNHNKKFFELQEKEMPDWEKWKNKLELLLA